MSKIAEQKALEAYPQKYDNLLDTNVHRRIGYRQGYDQAMQDFLEKSCEWLSKNARNYYSAYATSYKLIEDFKNYMQHENN